jgi:hypothetical protein
MDKMLKDYVETKVYLLKHLVGLAEFKKNDVVIETEDNIVHLKALSENKNGKFQWGSRTQKKILKECEKIFKGGVLNVYINW